MNTYPEHEKQAKIVDQSQAIGEFIEWLQSQGVSLMRYGPLKDFRSCLGPDGMIGPSTCDGGRVMRYGRDQGECTKCGGSGHKEITVETYYSDSRSITTLLAEFFEIDLVKIEQENRAILEALRAS